MKKKLIVLSGFVLGFAPVVALAQLTGGTLVCGGGLNSQTGTIGNILCKIAEILNAIVPVLVALGVVYFVWGVIQYVIGTDAETKASAVNKIIYGIIGLAVIIAVWGLVKILTNTFLGSNLRTDITYPTVPLQ